jgi:hypothetical protein
MWVRLCFACLLISIPFVAFAQQSSQTKSDRDKAGLRGPVKTALEDDTVSLANGAPTSTTTTTYATHGRILEEWARNPDGLEWVMSDTYDSAAPQPYTISGSAADSALRQGWPAQQFAIVHARWHPQPL